MARQRLPPRPKRRTKKEGVSASTRTIASNQSSKRNLDHATLSQRMLSLVIHTGSLNGRGEKLTARNGSHGIAENLGRRLGRGEKNNAVIEKLRTVGTTARF
jgi:hypothetical protein